MCKKNFKQKQSPELQIDTIELYFGFQFNGLISLSSAKENIDDVVDKPLPGELQMVALIKDMIDCWHFGAREFCLIPPRQGSEVSQIHPVP